MKVWAVQFGDYEGVYLCSIWSTQEKADLHKSELELQSKSRDNCGYSVDEIEVDNPDMW